MTTDRSALLDRVIVDGRRGTPLHLQLQRALRSMIDEHFDDGDSFFTETALTERLKVSRGTVRQALGELSREGVLLRRAAKGTMVCKGGGARMSRHGRHSAGAAAVETVGVFVAQYDSDFLSAVLEQVSAACRAKGARLQVYHTHRGERIADAYHEVALPPDRERILLLSTPGAADLYKALSDRGYRVVVIESPGRGFAGAAVETDSTMAVHLGLGHLIALGHRRITMLVNEPASVSSVAEKMGAFRDVARKLGLENEMRVVVCGTELWNSSYDAAYAQMEQVWESRPTAVFTTSDPGAWAALKWLAERGQRVPEQVSVLGFEDARPSRFTNPSLTTVAHPIEALGKAAVELLWTSGCRIERLAPRLIVRESTGAARPDR